MLDFLKNNQLNIMLALSSICITIALFEILTVVNTKKKKALLMLEISSAILLMSDRAEYMYDGNTSTTGFWMVRITSFLLYFFTLLAMYAYNQYLKQVFTETKGLSPNHKRFKIIDIIIVIGELLVISTPFTGLYYTFDESNVYSRGPGILIGFSLPLVILVLFLSLTLQYYKHLPKRMRLLLFLFTGNPLFSAIYQLCVMYFEVINLTIGAMAILLYVFDLLDVKAMEKHNKVLKDEVAKRNARLIKMQDNLIMSMAMMVESRDDSTGGHIQRTREVIRIISEEMEKDPECKLSKDFLKAVLQAAPMHDLGKVAIDDAILRKHGNFSAEEFDFMKTHAEKGATVLHDVLKNTDDDDFKTIAENMAHYHHEKWDGTGYPCGLKGEEIPIEARIMAIADVYDTVISKRDYKENLSFEETDKMIMEGMGTYFDKELEKYYVAARPKLEEYYRTAKF